MNFECLPFVKDLFVRAACHKYDKADIAALYLGMSVRALYEARKRLGFVGCVKPDPPSKEQWYQLLDLVPRKTVELYLLESTPDDRS